MKIEPAGRGLTLSDDPDRRWIARALELAAEADYRTSPNPMVGAVVLDADGDLVGEGFHALAGEPHAEVHALAQAGLKARGGSLYINLEPCSHQGRTPPCTDAVMRAGISRVVLSMLDPDPKVNGAGVRRLREAGIAVEIGAAENEARRLNEFYVKHRTTGRPFVSVKFAASLDGKIATATGESTWITGEEARRHAHRLRHMHDAVLVGINTVLRDDPELTSRPAEPEAPRQPLRVVVDSRLRTPPTAKVVGPNTLIATTRSAPALALAEVATLPATDSGRVDLAALLDLLGRRGVLSVLVEGGGAIHGGLFEADLVDRVYAYLSPLVIGGAQAPTAVAGRGASRLAEAHRLRKVQVMSLGYDFLITGYVHRDH